MSVADKLSPEDYESFKTQVFSLLQNLKTSRRRDILPLPRRTVTVTTDSESHGILPSSRSFSRSVYQHREKQQSHQLQLLLCTQFPLGRQERPVSTNRWPCWVNYQTSWVMWLHSSNHNRNSWWSTPQHQLHHSSLSSLSSQTVFGGSLFRATKYFKNFL